MRRTLRGRVAGDAGVVGIAGVAAALALGAVAHLSVPLRTESSAAGSVLAAGLLVLAAGTVAWGSLWLRSATTTAARIRVAGWVGAGVVALSVVGAALLAVHAGDVAASSTATLLVLQAGGAVGGLGGGLTEWRSVAHERRQASEAEPVTGTETDFEFVNGVLRHHLLNGLQIVDAYADEIAASADGATAGRAERIRYRSRRLATLVENVRALVEAEHGAADRDAVDAVAVLRETVGGPREFDAAVSVGECPGSAPVAADALFGTLIDALLRAAAAGERGADRITVRVERTADRVLVRVADDRDAVSDATGAVLGSKPGYEDVERRTQTDEGVALHLADTLLDRYEADAWLTERDDGVTVTVALDRAVA